MSKKNKKNKKKNKKMAVKKSPTTTKKKPVKKKPKKKTKYKSKSAKYRKRKTRNFILITSMIFLISIFVAAIAFTTYIIFTAPKFNEKEFYNSESTVLYDLNGNEFAKLGEKKRELVAYDELPQVFIDALIATEDSRYFQHNGFDIARFTKASLGQLGGKSDAGGGSTITMQISKNYLTSTEASGIQGIIRKFTDIYLSIFKIERDYTKEEIIEFYVNRPYLGARSYGVEEAAQTYFGKSIKDVSLPEAAMIAGLFQAPDYYNPYNNPDRTEARKNRVLYLMKHHGYISKLEKETATKIHVKDLILDNSDHTNQYQGFIDTVTADVLKKTGKNPYKTSMLIYTTLDPKVQKVVDDVTNGVTHKFVNDVVQLGVAVTSVKDGSVVAIGAGRNRSGERTFNFATDIRRHAASSAKPYTVYGPGIEYEKWSTGTLFFDDHWGWSSGGSLKNADGRYNGMMNLKDALARSRNIPAVQGFQQLDNKKAVDFTKKLGLKIDTLPDGTTYESAAIGGVDGVSPLEQSAAYAAFGRNGYYIEPYTYTKIIFRDTGETIEHTPKKEKVMDEKTAAMVNKILVYTVDRGLIGKTKIKNTDLAGKTGTSTFSTDFRKKVGLPASAVMDSWVVMYSPDYSTAQWYGYHKMTAEMVKEKHFLVSSAGVRARKSIAQALTNGIMKNNSKFDSVSGLKQVTIEKETLPLALPSANTPAEFKSSEWFIAGTEPTEVSTRFETLNNVSNIKHSYNSTTGNLTISWDPILPPALGTDEGINAYWQNAMSVFSANMSKKLDSRIQNIASKYANRQINYKNSSMGTIVYQIYTRSNSGSLTHLGTTGTTSYSFNTYTPNGMVIVVKASYSIFKGSISSGAAYTVTTSNPTQPDEPEKPETNGTVDISLRHTAEVHLKTGPGTYTDFKDPVNVLDNLVNVTNQATIKTTFEDSSGNTISSIPLANPGTFKVIYNIKYKGKNYEAIRTIIIEN